MAQYTFMSEKTGKRIAAALERMAAVKDLEYLPAYAEYEQAGFAAWAQSHITGDAYGISIPKGSATTITKTGHHAGWAAPTPGIVGRAADDPYMTGSGPFWYCLVNAAIDVDGTAHIKAIEGDGRFKLDGSMGEVFQLHNVLYEAFDSSGNDYVLMSISDACLAGMAAHFWDRLPSGEVRPFILTAVYVGVKGEDNYMHSWSGRKPWTRSVSHDSMITQCRNASTGYSGKAVGDDWYVKTMFLMKYGTKHSQSVFAGCTNYSAQVAPTVAETGVTRVIVSNADAAKFQVGSAVMLGTHTGDSTDRNVANNYDVLDGVRILSIEEYDAGNMALVLDTTETFDTATTYLLSTSPWFSGSLDQVEGDGTITDAGRTNGREPFKLQGIECMVGVYEILGNVILSNTGSGWEPCVNPDSANEATSVTSDYMHAGKYLPSGASDAWHYPMYPVESNGLLFGDTEGASQTTGMCDGQYTNKTETTGMREWLGLGFLAHGGAAGLFCVYGANGLPSAGWHLGSRLSGIGRGRA